MTEARYIRRGIALGGSAAAVLLAMASAASACTYFQGSLTITGKDSTGAVTPAPAGFPVAGSSLAWGSGNNMTYCLGGNPTGYTYAPAISGSAKVDVAPRDCGGMKQLPNTVAGDPSTIYDVNFLNVGAFTNYSNRNWVQDCMSDTTSGTENPTNGTPGVRSTQTRKVGEMTVTNGVGTATVSLNKNGEANTVNATTSPTGTTAMVPSEEAGICVSSKVKSRPIPQGMQGPITII